MLDDSRLPCASQTAAGFINPVTGKWLTKSWAIDTLIPIARTFYQSIEAALGIHIQKKLPIRRFFINEADLKRAERRIKNPRYVGCFKNIHPPGTLPNGIEDTFGSIEIDGGSWVDVPLLLDTLKHYFASKGCYKDSYFDENKLKKGVSERAPWHYEDLEIKNIIFCQGIHALKNEYFSKLPISPIKGDTLSFKLNEAYIPEGLYYKKRWLHALETHSENQIYRLGATYVTDTLDATPSNKAKIELLDALKNMLGRDIAPEIIEHKSGIRPTSTHTRPFIIQHPEHKTLYAINGLGSKGTSTAPCLSQAMTNHLYEAQPLPNDFNIC